MWRDLPRTPVTFLVKYPPGMHRDRQLLAKSVPLHFIILYLIPLKDGFLKCGLTNMAVRPQDGMKGLREGLLSI